MAFRRTPWLKTLAKFRAPETLEVARFGKPFATSFRAQRIRGIKRSAFRIELLPDRVPGISALSVCLMIENTVNHAERPIAAAGIAFERNAVIIREIQGGFEEQQHLSRFYTVTGRKWADFLCEKIEMHAKATGYSETKLSVPESLPWFKKMHSASHIRLSKTELGAIAQEVELLSREQNLGPERKQWLFEELKAKKQVEKAKDAIKRLYYGIANARRYSKEGEFFIKRL